MESICASEQWHRLFKNGKDGEYTEYLLRLEALHAVSKITRKPPNEEEFCPNCVSQKDADREWRKYLDDARLKNATWDAEHQKFVEGDSTPKR